jgi:hypothetical protein
MKPAAEQSDPATTGSGRTHAITSPHANAKSVRAKALMRCRGLGVRQLRKNFLPDFLK